MLNGFVKIDTWISLSCYMDLPKSLHGFVKVATWICQCLCISHPLPDTTTLKFDQDIKACWRFCFELKVLNDPLTSLGPLRLWQIFWDFRHWAFLDIATSWRQNLNKAITAQTSSSHWPGSRVTQYYPSDCLPSQLDLHLEPAISGFATDCKFGGLSKDMTTNQQKCFSAIARRALTDRVVFRGNLIVRQLHLAQSSSLSLSIPS